jgi:hypothetical protein
LDTKEDEMNVDIAPFEAQVIANALAAYLPSNTDWGTVVAAASVYTKMVNASQAAQAAAPADPSAAVDSSTATPAATDATASS